MRRLVQFGLFFSVFVTLWGGLHYYLWARAVRDTGAPAAVSIAAVVLLAFLSVLPIAARVVAFPKAIAGLAHGLGWGWLGLLGLTDVVLFGTDLARFALSVAWASDGATSLIEAARVQAGIGVAGGFGLAALSWWNAHAPTPLKRVEVTVDRWPLALDGYKIVQLSDVHVTAGTPIEWVRDLVDRTNAEKPDLVALTGDLVDGAPEPLSAAMQPFSDLRATDGTYFVTGNHEFYSGADRWIDVQRRLGARVLQNERITVGAGERAFELAGVPDWRGGDFGPNHQPRLADTLAGRDETRPVVLLAHQPRQFPEAARQGVALQLSGHTHGGQVWPFTHLVRLVEPFHAGLYKQGVSQLYVSRGTGYWGPAMRLGAPMELTVLTLRSPAAKA